MTSQLGAFTNRWHTPDVNLCFSGKISCHIDALLDLTTIINGLKYLSISWRFHVHLATALPRVMPSNSVR